MLEFFKFHPNIIYYSRISHNSANLGMLGVFEKIANNGPKSGQKCLKNSPEGVNRLRMATFGLVCFLHFFYSIAVIRTFGVMHMSHLERSDKKSEENRLPQKWPFWGDLHLQENLLDIFGHFLGHCWLFSQKKTNLPRFGLFWDDSTIYLGEIKKLSTIGRFFFA